MFQVTWMGECFCEGIPGSMGDPKYKMLQISKNKQAIKKLQRMKYINFYAQSDMYGTRSQ